MKAKEWAAKFKKEEVLEFAHEFIKETKELIEKRGSSVSAIEGAVREQDNKLRAIGKIAGCEDWCYVEELVWTVFEKMESSLYKSYIGESVKKRERQFMSNLRYKSKIERAKIDKEPNPTVRLGMLLALILDQQLQTEEFNEVHNVKQCDMG